VLINTHNARKTSAQLRLCSARIRQTKRQIPFWTAPSNKINCSREGQDSKMKHTVSCYGGVVLSTQNGVKNGVDYYGVFILVSLLAIKS
jgi:hypothetical protein